MLHLRTLGELATTLRTLMRDEINERWTEREMQQAILLVLDEWSGRVSCEAVYTLADGWLGETVRYALPDYMDPTRIEPQFQAPADDWLTISWSDTSERRWVTFPNWRVVNGDLELGERVNAAGRIVFWVTPQCTMETSTVDGAHSATATTITLNSVPSDAPLAGWVQIGNEWMSYAGIDLDALQLQNVSRGEKGAAAALTNDQVVTWGICAPTPTLWNQLLDATRARLHEMYLTDASPRETATHERMVQFYRSRADQFWRGWAPQRQPRMKIDQVLGDL